MDKSREIIKVSIIEDDEAYMDSLKQILLNDRLHLYGDYTSGHEFLSTLNSPFQPDVCLVDIVLGDMSGIDCCKRIKETKPDVQLIIMTAYPDVKTFSEARQLGADYVEKGTRIETLMDKLITMMESSKNESLISISNHTKLGFEDYLNLVNELEASNARSLNLSEKQIQVLRLKNSGKSLGEIAKMLNMSYGTVQTHLTRAMNKLKLPNLLDYIVGDKRDSGSE